MNDLLNRNKITVFRLLPLIEEQYKLKVKPKMKFGRTQTVKDRFTKLRHLCIPSYPLKAIQQQINDHLQNVELPDFMLGSVPGSNNIINALQHINNDFFLTIDLKNFFPNINNYQINKVFIKVGFSHSDARILTRLTTYNNSLPQGAPSSPVLGNLAFLDTALQLENLAKNHNITFTTYLDDLVFSSKKDFKHLIPDFFEIIKSHHFFLNHKKIKYQKNFCEITGLIVRNGKIEIEPGMAREAKKNIKIQRYIEKVRWTCSMNSVVIN